MPVGPPAVEDGARLLAVLGERAGRRNGGRLRLTIETERELDGRWIAEVPELPGAMVYGSTCDEAITQVEILSLRVLAENIEEDGRPVEAIEIRLAAGDRLIVHAGAFCQRCNASAGGSSGHPGS